VLSVALAVQLLQLVMFDITTCVASVGAATAASAKAIVPCAIIADER
jgi:hypothetical protein